MAGRNRRPALELDRDVEEELRAISCSRTRAFEWVERVRVLLTYAAREAVVEIMADS